MERASLNNVLTVVCGLLAVELLMITKGLFMTKRGQINVMNVAKCFQGTVI
jgi:hypothetical protein